MAVKRAISEACADDRGRADETARSTSSGAASAICATGAPVAGSITMCEAPPVRTGSPSIQLLATSVSETTVMAQNYRARTGEIYALRHRQRLTASDFMVMVA